MDTSEYTPVISVWADPRELDPTDLPALAEAAQVQVKTLIRRADAHRAFMFVRRQMTPDQAQVILDMKLPGVYGQQEYKRFYPTGEVAAHLMQNPAALAHA